MENEKKSNISFLKVMGTEETFFPNLLNFFQALIHSEGEEITETFTLFYPTSLEELKTTIVDFLKENNIEINCEREESTLPVYLSTFCERLNKNFFVFFVPSNLVNFLSSETVELLKRTDNWSTAFLDMKLL
jgi:hypothetical protein